MKTLDQTFYDPQEYHKAIEDLEKSVILVSISHGGRTGWQCYGPDQDLVKVKLPKKSSPLSRFITIIGVSEIISDPTKPFGFSDEGFFVFNSKGFKRD